MCMNIVVLLPCCSLCWSVDCMKLHDEILLYLLNPSLIPFCFPSESCLLLFVLAWTCCYCYANSHAIDWWWFWWTWISNPAAVKLLALPRILIECCIGVLLFRCAWAYCFIAMFACHEVCILFKWWGTWMMDMKMLLLPCCYFESYNICPKNPWDHECCWLLDE